MRKNELCQSIANTICDYRCGEFGAYNKDHVEHWISQFNIDEQKIVLEGTDNLLKRCFITKQLFLSFIYTLISSAPDGIDDEDVDSFWSEISLLDIQLNGNSQKELNKIFCSDMYNRCGTDRFTGRKSDVYLYLDDFIFSGNRLYQDLERWILTDAPQTCRVIIATIGWYSYGRWDAERKLKELVKREGKKIFFDFASFQDYQFENRLSQKDISDVFWPTASVNSTSEIVSFIKDQDFNPQYRLKKLNGNGVFSNLPREEYERIILKYGIKIMSFSTRNSPVVKPLGYSTYKGFGFGSTVFSFRNCPNNNPLVFWWGDPSAPITHPFSKWYPLMQRKTYGQ